MSILDGHREQEQPMTHPLLPWIADRWWFGRALAEDRFLFHTHDGTPIVGTFPEPLLRTWLDANTFTFDPDPTRPATDADGLELLAVLIDEALTTEDDGTMLQSFGLTTRSDTTVAFIDEWVPSKEPASGLLPMTSPPSFDLTPTRPRA